MVIFTQIYSNLSLLTNVQDAHGVKDFWANSLLVYRMGLKKSK